MKVSCDKSEVLFYAAALDSQCFLYYIVGMKELTEEEITDVSDFFKVFGDPTRLKLLILLDNKGEMGVNAISESLGMSQSAISQQLKVLRQMRLVRFRRDGRSSIYRLSDEHIREILKLGFEHYEEQMD